MDYSLILFFLALAFFLLLLLAMNIGRRLGRGGDEKSRAGSAAVEASVFALLGLLIAFTFSGRRSAWRSAATSWCWRSTPSARRLRIDLLAAPAQPALRDAFRRYVDERINYYRHVADLEAREAIAAKVAGLQKQIWQGSIQAANDSVPPFAASYINAVNEMFDVATTQSVAQKVHPPIMAYLFLGLLALVSAALVGMNLAVANRSGWMHRWSMRWS